MIDCTPGAQPSAYHEALRRAVVAKGNRWRLVVCWPRVKLFVPRRNGRPQADAAMRQYRRLTNDRV